LHIIGQGYDSFAWTTVWDVNLNRTFMSCVTNKVLAEELWAPGQPDNAGGMEPQSVVNLCAACNLSGFYDDSAMRNRSVLCYEVVKPKACIYFYLMVIILVADLTYHVNFEIIF
jgi:hypothetical protein